MAEQSYLLYGLLAVSIGYLLRWFSPSYRKLDHIPTVGPSAPILSYWGCLKYMMRGMDMVTEGYHKYRGGVFKVANLHRWVVIVSGPKLVDELAKALDDDLSFQNALDEEVPALHLTLGAHMGSTDHFLKTIRTTLTNSLHTLVGEIQDEVVNACDTCLPEAKEWTAAPAARTFLDIIARVSNRSFVGLDFCRNPDYLKVVTDITADAVIAGHILAPFPSFLKQIAARLFTRLPATVDRGTEILRPEIQRRLALNAKYGRDYADKPYDFLSWLIDGRDAGDHDARDFTYRIMLVNFASMHTSAGILALAVFQLAAHPEWARILREEAEETRNVVGWSKESIESMYKADSLIKECLRLYSIACVNILRQAAKDFTFSDGTFIPKGTQIKAAVLPMQHDPTFYEDPEDFKPWRFSDARQQEGDSVKHDVINIDIDYLTFGYGRHTCPGRWFAAAELKLLLAHLVTTYDMKAEKEGVVPAPVHIGSAIIPDQRARVLFKRRRT